MIGKAELVDDGNRTMPTPTYTALALARRWFWATAAR